MAKQLILVRHCFAPLAHKHDASLTSEGRMQAASLASQFRKDGLMVQFALQSRARRAVDTADVILGDFNQRAFREIPREVAPWLSDEHDELYSGKHVEALDPAVDSILIVTHENTVRNLICALQGLPEFYKAREDLQASPGWSRRMISEARTWPEFVADTAKAVQDYKPGPVAVRPPSSPGWPSR